MVSSRRSSYQRRSNGASGKQANLVTANIYEQPDITLQEFGSCEAELPAEVFAILRTRYSKHIEVTHTGRQGVYRLAARDYVGRVALPGGRVLVVQPKVSVTNLFYMLCVDASLAGFHMPAVSLREAPDIFGFVVEAALDAIERVLQQGLQRAYTPIEEDLPLVRGRIMLGAQIHRHGDLKHRHVCTYADLTEGTPENRVIAATLHYIPLLLRRSDEASLVRRARALLQRFENVGTVSRSAAITLIPGISLHRMNTHYAPALGLCKLLLHQLTLSEERGSHPFSSFFIDMPRLFESFVTLKLRAALKADGLRVVAQQHDYLDDERLVGIRPDVLVYASAGKEPLLVLDAKYRRLDEGEGDLNRDLYQVSAYLDRYNLHKGVLVYPQFEGRASTELKLSGTPKRLHLATLDLSAESPTALDRECARLASHVAGLAAGRQ